MSNLSKNENDNNMIIIREKERHWIRFRAVGDINFGGRIGRRLTIEKEFNPIPPLCQKLGMAHLAFFNLECCPISGPDVIIEKFNFASPAFFLDKIKCEFNIAGIANNHMLDLGLDYFRNTLQQLQKRDFKIVGGGDNLLLASMMTVIKVNEIRVGFLACADYVDTPHGKGNSAKNNRPGVSIYNPREFVKRINSCKQEVDVLICSVHTGLEFHSYPDPALMKHCRSMVEAGADVILIHHAHVRQGIELYKNKIIAYGLGNFIFDINDPYMQQSGASTDTGLILDIILDRHGIIEYGYRIAKLQSNGQTLILPEDENSYHDQANLNNKLHDFEFVQDEWEKTCRKYLWMRIYALYWAMKRLNYSKFFRLIWDLRRRENYRWILGLLKL